MNRFLQNLFLVLFPFYPFWSWICYLAIKKPFDFVANLLLLPFALYFVLFRYKKLPAYLLFLIIFTIYYLISVYVTNAVPDESNAFYFILSDFNVLACVMLIVVEYMNFNEKFIKIMNRNILLILLI